MSSYAEKVLRGEPRRTPYSEKMIWITGNVEGKKYKEPFSKGILSRSLNVADIGSERAGAHRERNRKRHSVEHPPKSLF